ncbi:MAG: Re/Si-specific NAD(P)(+) transhydrogenase subunit alpha [Chloroflexi bacterium]|nr:Re/Si-specific NAD(P)(+) transhydrogenase subunit alpha [Chloroflexota bacterium]
MKVGIPRETAHGERRVALVPDLVARLTKAGSQVFVEVGAGAQAFFPDGAYEAAGATLLGTAAELYAQSDVVLKVQRPHRGDGIEGDEAALLRAGSTIIALLQPLNNLDLVRQLAVGGVIAFSMDSIPRIARAQKMDALSSQASIAGYKAALRAAESLGKHFPLMMTAAGTMPPAKGLVVGAGVAGLQAIATARRLGAVMQAFDVRPAVKEQVESLGATFLVDDGGSADAEDSGGYARELTEDHQRRERELIHRHARDADFIITTALIPGRPAPLLITKEMVRDMRPGSVIVDLAAEAGGNCELTMPGQDRMEGGVLIIAPLNLPSEMPIHASQMYARNMYSFLEHVTRNGELHLDFSDPITAGACITNEGRIIHPQILAAAGAARNEEPAK